MLRHVRDKLAKDGIHPNTRISYNSALYFWFRFCEWYGNEDRYKLTVDIALDFVAWCYHTTPLNSGQADKALTAVGSFLKDAGLSFDRKAHPAIRRHLDGYEHNRPPKRRKKMPFSEYHVMSMFDHCVNDSVFNEVTGSTAVLCGYKFGLRPSEVAKSATKPLFEYRRVEFLPSRKNPTSVCFHVKDSKMNRKGYKLEKLYQNCTCKDDKIYPCVVHRLLFYFDLRRRRFGAIKPKDPVFVTRSNAEFTYSHLNTFMKNVIINLNSIKRLKMNPSHYTPHALRLGGCTDKAREGFQGWRI